MDTKIPLTKFRHDIEMQSKMSNNRPIQVTEIKNSGKILLYSETIFSDVLKKTISLLGNNAERKITSFFAESSNLTRQEFFANHKIAQKTLPLIFGLNNTKIILNAVKDKIQKDVDCYTSESLEEILQRIDKKSITV